MTKLQIKYLTWAIILLGIFLRFSEYIENHSLWADEATVAIRVSSSSLRELTQFGGTSSSDLSYPAGFLLVTKFMSLVFGNGEFSLRLYPFICGILALIVFAKLCSKLFTPHWNLLALSIFAISRDLIFYSCELKPYSSDVFIALLLLLLFLEISRREMNKLMIVGLGVLGVIAILFSFPAVCVLAGVGGGFILFYSIRKDWNKVKGIFCAAFIWSIGFILYYFLSLRYFLMDKKLAGFWDANFMPVSEGWFACFQWLVVVFKRLFVRGLKIPQIKG